MKKFPKRHTVVWVATILWDCVSFLIVLFLHLLGGKRLEWCDGLWTIIKQDSFLKHTLFKTTSGGCLGHGGWIAEDNAGKEGLDTSTEFHEHVHVEQYEYSMCFVLLINLINVFFGFYYGYINHLWYLVLIQLLGGVFSIGISVVVTYLRGEDIYWGSSHEEAAYARTAIEFEEGGK